MLLHLEIVEIFESDRFHPFEAEPVDWEVLVCAPEVNLLRQLKPIVTAALLGELKCQPWVNLKVSEVARDLRSLGHCERRPVPLCMDDEL